MTRLIPALIAAATIIGASEARAQDIAPGPGRIEITLIPGGGLFFTENDAADEPGFGNYDVGAGFGVNFNRIVGLEAEFSGALGITQDLRSGGLTGDRKTPNILNYSGNLVLSAPTRTAVVPYVTAGIGGLTLLEERDLGINGNETFLTGNVGGGLKWYSGRWGLRADYRFVGVRSRDDAPQFFGRDARYGHRVYGAVIINAVQ